PNFTSLALPNNQIGHNGGSFTVQSPISWDADSTMGTLDANGTSNLYIEDSTIKYIGQFPDVDSNARVVIRKSQLIGTGRATHGPSSGTGGRFVEYYDNSFSAPNQNQNLSGYYWMRGATGVFTGNRVSRLDLGPCYGSHSWIRMTAEIATRAT